MSEELFRNQLRCYNIISSGLKAASKDICKKCIGLEGAKLKISKRLKKMKMDVGNSDIPENKKKDLLTHIEFLSKETEEIPVEEECSCQKTTGNCKIGPECFVNGLVALLNLITEPKE